MNKCPIQQVFGFQPFFNVQVLTLNSYISAELNTIEWNSVYLISKILINGKTIDNKKSVVVGRRGSGEDEETEHRGFLGLWKYPVWYYNGQCMSL